MYDLGFRVQAASCKATARMGRPEEEEEEEEEEGGTHCAMWRHCAMWSVAVRDLFEFNDTEGEGPTRGGMKRLDSLSLSLSLSLTHTHTHTHIHTHTHTHTHKGDGSLAEKESGSAEGCESRGLREGCESACDRVGK